MSYILDALKKSEEERERGTVPKLTTNLGADLTTKRRMWPWVIGAALFANAAVLSVFLWPSEMPPVKAQRSAEKTVEETAESGKGAEPTKKPTAPTAMAEQKSAPKQKIETVVVTAAAVKTKPMQEPLKAALEPKSEPKSEPRPAVEKPPRLEPAPKPATASPSPEPENRESAALESSAPATESVSAKTTPPPKPVRLPPKRINVASALSSRSKTMVKSGPAVKTLNSMKSTAATALALPLSAGGGGYSAAYYNRGWAFANKLQFEQAIEDYTQSIRLDQRNADAYFARGWAYEKEDKINLALKDYDRAIKIKPKHALAYNNRGVLQLYRNRYDQAAEDFTRSYTLAGKPLQPYVLLWLYLSRVRSGGDGKKELDAYAKKLDLRPWPGILVSMFLGKATSDQVLQGTKDKNNQKQKEKECVAFYFLGQQRLLEGDSDGARAFFQRAIDTGMTTYIQFGAAQKELSRL